MFHDISNPITARGNPITSQSVNETVIPGTKSSTVALAMRLGAVLIKRSMAPAVAACPKERKLASVYLFISASLFDILLLSTSKERESICLSILLLLSRFDSRKDVFKGT